MDNETPAIGHNQRQAVMSPEAIAELLAETEIDLVKRSAALVDGLGRTPADITHENAPRVADFILQLNKFEKLCEAQRKAGNEPFRAATAAVDGFFRKLYKETAAGATNLQGRYTKWQQEQARLEQARRDEALRLAREQAARAEAAARAAEEAMSTDAGLADAILADAAAAQAQADKNTADKKAAANLADMSRTRGDLGAVASLRTFWDMKDLDRASIDLEALRTHLPLPAIEQAIRSYVKAGGRELKGVTIFENSSTVIR